MVQIARQCKLQELVYAHKEHLERKKKITELVTYKIHYHLCSGIYKINQRFAYLILLPTSS
jgi:hypothetical protein